MELNGKILIVDDDAANRALLADILEDLYDIELASNGAEAVSKIVGFRPDIILLDIMMPEVDGYEVCNVVRSLDEHKFTKIILLSAKIGTIDRIKGYECGADDYLCKPFVEEELLAKIRVFLRLKYREEIDLLKSNVVMLAAHELRTPLTGIIGGVEIMKELIPTTEENAEVFEIIERNSERLKRFVEKIVLFNSITKEIDLERKKVCVRDLVRDAVSQLNSQSICVSQVKFSYDESMDIIVYVDRYYFVLALACLFEYIISSAIDTPQISISWKKQGHIIEVNIIDHCASCEKELSENDFEPLATEDIHHYHNGNGLELAIARSVARAHLGDLVCDKHLNEFNEYVFSFSC